MERTRSGKGERTSSSWSSVCRPSSKYCCACAGVGASGIAASGANHQREELENEQYGKERGDAPAATPRLLRGRTFGSESSSGTGARASSSLPRYSLSSSTTPWTYCGRRSRRQLGSVVAGLAERRGERTHLGRSRRSVDSLSGIDLARVEEVVLVFEHTLMQLVVERLRLAELCARGRRVSSRRGEARRTRRSERDAPPRFFLRSYSATGSPAMVQLDEMIDSTLR